MKKIVYIATGIEGLDADIKEILDRKNIVSKPIFYKGFLLGDEIDCETVILSRRLGPEDSDEKISTIIDALKKKGIRIIFLLSADFEHFDTCLEYGIYDVVSDPIDPFKITDMYEKPSQYNDILPLKEMYDQKVKQQNPKPDPELVMKKLENISEKQTSKTIEEKEFVETSSPAVKLVEESDPDGLFSVLNEDIPTGSTEEAEKECEELKVDSSTEVVKEAEDSIESSFNEKGADEGNKNQNFENSIEDSSANLKEDKKLSVPAEVMTLGDDEILEEQDTIKTDPQFPQDESMQLIPEEQRTYTVNEENKKKNEKISKPMKIPSLKKLKSFINKKNNQDAGDEKIIVEKDDPIEVEVEETQNEVVRSSRKEKIDKTIGIIGSERSVGTTYASLLLAHSLSYKKKVLYVTTNDDLYKTLNITNEVQQFPFEIVKYDESLYKIYNDYDHLIYNCSTVDDPAGFNLFYTLQRKILMISLLPYKMKALTAIEASSYVDVTCILGYEQDEKYLKGIEVRSNFKDKKYLAKMQDKLLGKGR